MKIDDYIIKHTITKIGVSLPNYIICEVIVDDPFELIPVVKNNNCYISQIGWWEHSEITTGSTIGYGGPRDPRSPEMYYFAETDICRNFNSNTKEEEYYEYLDQIIDSYPHHNLVPAFDIKPTNQSS